MNKVVLVLAFLFSIPALADEQDGALRSTMAGFFDLSNEIFTEGNLLESSKGVKNIEERQAGCAKKEEQLESRMRREETSNLVFLLKTGKPLKLIAVKAKPEGKKPQCYSGRSVGGECPEFENKGDTRTVQLSKLIELLEKACTSDLGGAEQQIDSIAAPTNVINSGPAQR